MLGLFKRVTHSFSHFVFVFVFVSVFVIVITFGSSAIIVFDILESYHFRKYGTLEV